MSLRGRLLVVLLALVALGLVAADVATYAELNRFLVKRVDQQLESTRRPVELAVQLPDRFPNAAEGPGGRAEAYVQVRDPAGNVIGTYRSTHSAEKTTPRIPAVLPRAGVDPQEVRPRTDLPGAAAAPAATPTTGTQPATIPPATAVPALPTARGAATFRTVGSVGGGPPWRLRVAGLPNGDTLVVALPMRDVDATLHDLRWIELAVTATVLLAVAGAGLWLVRLGLRPLYDIEETAEDIAAGDLTRRVPDAPSRTEIGRLGIALNGMLTQIEQAFGERQESEDRLRQFVADASHELRTPLTSIRGYAELFRRGGDHRPEDLAKIMRRIEEEAIRMGLLVDDLLLLARVDQGRTLELDPVDLSEIVHDAVEALRVADDAHPVTLSVADDVVVLGDRARLRQIVDNLLANVRVHTPAGTTATVTLTGDDRLAVLEVADAGPGLSVEQAARVFERFYRTDVSRTRDRGGSGLGLAIVQSLVQAHAGIASVTSEPGRGTRFRVELPRHGPPPPRPEEAGGGQERSGPLDDGGGSRPDDLVGAQPPLSRGTD